MSIQVCPGATALQAAGRADVHDARGVSDRARTGTFRHHRPAPYQLGYGAPWILPNAPVPGLEPGPARLTAACPARLGDTGMTDVARTGLEPATVLGESQATLPIRPPRQVVLTRVPGAVRTRGLRRVGAALYQPELPEPLLP